MVVRHITGTALGGATLALVTLAVAAVARPAAAQTWDVTVHGAFAAGRAATGGTSSTPDAGPTFVLADGIQTSRAVSSWYFGDGVALFNQVAQLRGVTARLTPLESGNWPAVGRKAGAVLGARVTRSIGRRLAIEGAVDLAPNAMGFPAEASDRIEAVRAAFEDAFRAMNNSSLTLMPEPSVASTAVTRAGGTTLVTTVSLVVRGHGTGAARPYLLAGAGRITTMGDGPSATLTGNYQLTNAGGIRFNETDTVTLRYDTPGALAWLVGGGVRRAFSPRSAWTIDARLLMSTNTARMFLSAAPSAVIGSPAGAALLNTSNPGLQFSTLTGIRTTLSGAPLAEFEAFKAGGMQVQFVLSVGYVRTF